MAPLFPSLATTMPHPSCIALVFGAWHCAREAETSVDERGAQVGALLSVISSSDVWWSLLLGARCV